MTVRSPTRRMVVVCAAALLAGAVARDFTEPFEDVWYALMRRLCGGSFGDPAIHTARDTSFACEQLAVRPSIPFLLTTGLVLVVMLAAFVLPLRWATGPIRDLIPPIATVGPQNLGHRINPGPGRDPMAELARTIDAMMDRIATGYEAQRRFAANASHELRTPLAVQRTLIEVGMAMPLTAEQIALLTAQLLETNERNERLIDGLLVLSESDRGLVSRTPLRLDEIVESVLLDHRDRTADAGLRISTRLQPRIVLGEQVLLERLVTNLVQNAIKYNRPGGSIDVQVGEQPALVVVNTGDDVPPEAVSGLFEPFRRLAGTRIDHSGGAGLGLAIARSITQAHGGTIAARPSGRDGLRFEVAFPPAGPHAVRPGPRA